MGPYASRQPAKRAYDSDRGARSRELHEPGSQTDETERRSGSDDQLGPVAKLGDAGPAGRAHRGVSDRSQLLLRQDLFRRKPPPDRREGSGKRGVKLGAGVSLDLGKGFFIREGGAERALGRHRVECVGDDQEVGGEGDVAAVGAVVAGPVQALTVILHGLRLLRGEPEPLEEARRQAGRAAHRLPVVRVQQTRLPQCGGVDRDLAEVVEPAGPPEPADVATWEPERLGQLAHAVCDPLRVTVRGAVALVHDVRERSRAPPRPLAEGRSGASGAARAGSARGRGARRTRGSTRPRSPAPRRARPRLPLPGDRSRSPWHGRRGGARASSRPRRPCREPRARAGRPAGRRCLWRSRRAGTRSRRRTRQPQRERANRALAPCVSGEAADREAAHATDEQCRPGTEDESGRGDDRRGDGEAVGHCLVAAEIVVPAMQQLGSDHRRRDQRERARRHRRKHEHMPVDRRPPRIP